MDLNNFQPDFAAALSAFMTDNPGAGGGLASGFRSNATQAGLYQDYLAGRIALAAPPGGSFHEYGLAADFNQPMTGYQDTLLQYGLTTLPGRAGINDPGHVQMAGNNLAVDNPDIGSGYAGIADFRQAGFTNTPGGSGLNDVSTSTSSLNSPANAGLFGPTDGSAGSPAPDYSTGSLGPGASFSGSDPSGGGFTPIGNSGFATVNQYPGASYGGGDTGGIVANSASFATPSDFVSPAGTTAGGIGSTPEATLGGAGEAPQTAPNITGQGQDLPGAPVTSKAVTAAGSTIGQDVAKATTDVGNQTNQTLGQISAGWLQEVERLAIRLMVVGLGFVFVIAGLRLFMGKSPVAAVAPIAKAA